MKSTLNKAVAGLVVSVGLLGAGAVYAVDITGAGATFPFPVYAKWAEAYKAKTGVAMNYQSIGSGGGIKQITAKTVDFGASDMPLKPEELNKAGLIQFPTVIGGVVPVVNLAGVTGLKLDGATLADIFLGKITKWNDPAIAKLNPGVVLPAEMITVVHRSDGSGTSFIFTNYLSKVSPSWKTEVGEGTAVSWKPGQLGGKGNEGVAVYVQRTKGAIGYVEYAYALQNKMNAVQLKNKEGMFVKADEDSFKAAAAGADWAKAPGFYEILTDEAGKGSWPISGATFILIHKNQEKPASGAEVLKFFDWAYANGDTLASQLDYVPLPDAVVKLIRASWTQVKDPAGKAMWK